MKILSKIAIAAFLFAPAVAAAEQPAEMPEGAEPPEHAEHHKDPTKEYNWAEHLAPFGSDSYKSYDTEGGPYGDGKVGPEKREGEEEPMSVPFIFVLINFGLLLILLGKKAGPVATQMAQKRSDEIKSALDEAARLRTAAKDKLTEYDSKLKKAETEIDEMIRTMRETAEAERQRIIAAAEAQAAAMKKEAAERIAAEIELARHTLQKEVVHAAASVAERVLREKTTASDQTKLVDSFIQDVTA